jgi:hypothetical protein
MFDLAETSCIKDTQFIIYVASYMYSSNCVS